MAKPKAKARATAKVKTKRKPRPAAAKPKARPKAKAAPKPKAAKPAAAKVASKPKTAKPAPASPKDAWAEAVVAAAPSDAVVPAAMLDPITAALHRDVGALYELVEKLPQGSETDLLLYKWMAIAADFGSAEAVDTLDDMLETSTLRYDDDHGAQGDVHFELALEYLTGTGGLPRDLVRGAAHLVEARRCDYPEQIQDGAKLVADARAKLDAEALAAFDGVYNGQPLAETGETDDDDDEEDYG